jgi:arginine-tRNA-protein transferase
MMPLSVSCKLTAPHPCAYLTDQSAQQLFVDSESLPLSTEHIYPLLIDQGFRRSGQQLYRPQCEHCQACIPIRVPVVSFQASRQQKRVFKNCTDWQITDKPAHFSAQHFALYQRYLNSRHPDHEAVGPKDYQAFLCSDNDMTHLHEFWWQQQLIAVAITDYLPQGLSAVYTFFDPEYAKLSPGSFAILWQIQRAQQLGLPYVYLGYWVANSQKMAYKNAYQPAEIWYQQQWQPMMPQ